MTKKTLIENYDVLLIRIDERQQDIQKDLAELKKKLFGNGQIGLCDRVNKNELDLKNLNDSTDKRISNIKYVVTLSTAIIITCITVLSYLGI